MENVPWHSDVKAFSEALAVKSNGEYEVACEHAHSCCVLLARAEKFKVASGKPFNSQDYMAATPSWAVYGAEEGGFDPDQARYRKERHHKSSQRVGDGIVTESETFDFGIGRGERQAALKLERTIMHTQT
ncbi:tRNA wybutosine-synthesis [Dillenia turbinata]|uniref:tRNA wybutosine-synthesis n=1 Tax=Dillenia turbinata TaxID=194707 RepID=A0AAN8VSU3_9MAGN